MARRLQPGSVWNRIRFGLPGGPSTGSVSRGTECFPWGRVRGESPTQERAGTKSGVSRHRDRRARPQHAPLKRPQEDVPRTTRPMKKRFSRVPIQGVVL